MRGGLQRVPLHAGRGALVAVHGPAVALTPCIACGLSFRVCEREVQGLRALLNIRIRRMRMRFAVRNEVETAMLARLMYDRHWLDIWDEHSDIRHAQTPTRVQVEHVRVDLDTSRKMTGHLWD